MDIVALVISGISLVLAVISFVISVKSQNLQNKVNEIELKLKKYELDEKEKQACVEARIIHEIKNRYKIKVWNSGNSIAKNVVASWDTQKGIIFFDKEKMPFEVLEPQKSFELVITTYDGTPGKLQIKTEWEDEIGEKKEKLQWCDM